MFLRTALFFAILMTAIRLMGKRQISQMEPTEFAVAMLISNLASIPIENRDQPLLWGVIPIVLVLAAQRLLSYLSLHSIGLRRILCGKPVILMENGQPLTENLRRTRVTVDELTSLVRQQGILDLSQVQYAILETNGALAVFPYPWFRPAEARDAGIAVAPQELPFTVISQGRLLEENLIRSGKSPGWLTDYLSGRGYTVSQVLLLTVTASGKTRLFPFDPPPGRG